MTTAASSASSTGTDVLPDPRTNPAELDERRRTVADLVCGLPGADPERLGFEHPWEIRAFAMAVAAHRELGFDWSTFQQALIASIQTWENDPDRTADSKWSYYQHWVAALEDVLAQSGVVDQGDLDHQTRDVLALPPNRNHHEAHTEPIAIDPARRTT
ncbi:hypothetical protein GCM10023350_21860 [Nocardioides endophyticus]|uniref:Nitrile hydratase beta subunit-like N-terminal domain-containing protein n=1 Tax=Nocardioides endophyticus TaxID=1353775 RepID=A0ABP8YTS4_9ACTN